MQCCEFLTTTAPCCCLQTSQVTGAGGDAEAAPTPAPAPTDAPTPAPAPADTPEQTPAPAAGIGMLAGAIQSVVGGGSSSSSGGTAAGGEAPPAAAETPAAAEGPGIIGNLTSTISNAAHSVTDAAAGIVGGGKKEGADAAAVEVAVPAVETPAEEGKEGKGAENRCQIFLECFPTTGGTCCYLGDSFSANTGCYVSCLHTDTGFPPGAVIATSEVLHIHTL